MIRRPRYAHSWRKTLTVTAITSGIIGVSVVIPNDRIGGSVAFAAFVAGAAVMLLTGRKRE
jgi:hypothetical protein